MSLSITIQNALSGLQTTESAIQIVSNNITNANTEGYTRKTAAAVSRTLDLEGRGVQIGELGRTVDERLLRDVRVNLAATGEARVLDSYYQRVIDQFGTLSGDSSLGAGLTDLATSLQNLTVAPENSANRIEVITNAVAVAKQLKDLSGQVQNLRYDADQAIAEKINVINGELASFAELNKKIEMGQSLGEATAELEDLRDQSLNKLSEFLDVQYYRRTNGEIVLTLPNGQIIADKIARPLSHTPAGALSADVSYAAGSIDGIFAGGVDITANIASGELKGFIDARDEILPNLQAELDQLTQTLRDEINLIHNQGTSLPPVQTLTGSRTFANPAMDRITLTGTTRIAVVDGTGGFVSSFDLAPGAYTVQEIEAAIDTNLAGFATASTGANQPLSISATNPAQGIAIVDLGEQTVTHSDQVSTFSGFSNYFGLNDLFVTPGRVAGEPGAGLAALIQVRGDIVTDPARLSRATLSTAAAPAAGDVALSPGDASVITALADRFIENSTFAAIGDVPQTTTTFAGFAGEILSVTAVSAHVTQKDMEFRASLAQELTFRTQEVSGVNIDEELRNLVLYENAYAANARLVQVADELLEILVNLGA